LAGVKIQEPCCCCWLRACESASDGCLSLIMRLWKSEWQTLVNSLRIPITVCHLPLDTALAEPSRGKTRPLGNWTGHTKSPTPCRIQAEETHRWTQHGKIATKATPSPPHRMEESRGVDERAFGMAPLLGPLPTRSSRGEEAGAARQILRSLRASSTVAIQIDTESVGRCPVLVRGRLGYYRMIGFSPWKSALLSSPYRFYSRLCVGQPVLTSVWSRRCSWPRLEVRALSA